MPSPQACINRDPAQSPAQVGGVDWATDCIREDEIIGIRPRGADLQTLGSLPYPVTVHSCHQLGRCVKASP
jgi:hypothetical protein